MASDGFFSALVDRVDAWQQKRPVLAVPVGVVVKYREDRGQQYAALLSYYGFISMFPLLLLFVAILSVLLEESPSLRDKIIDSILGRLPVLGTQINDQIDGGPAGARRALRRRRRGAALGRAQGRAPRAGRVQRPVGCSTAWSSRASSSRRSEGHLTLLVVIGVGIVARDGRDGPRRVPARSGRVHARRGSAHRDRRQRSVPARLVRDPHRSPRSGFEALLPGALRRRHRCSGSSSSSAAPTSAASWPNASDVYGAFAGVFGLLIWIALLARVVLLAGRAERGAEPARLAAQPAAPAVAAGSRGVVSALLRPHTERNVRRRHRHGADRASGPAPDRRGPATRSR